MNRFSWQVWAGMQPLPGLPALQGPARLMPVGQGLQVGPWLPVGQALGVPTQPVGGLPVGVALGQVGGLPVPLPVGQALQPVEPLVWVGPQVAGALLWVGPLQPVEPV